MASYYDEIEIEDFEYDPDDEIYYYPCPCGDRFQITKFQPDDVYSLCDGQKVVSVNVTQCYNPGIVNNVYKQEELKAGEEVATCPSCSLIIKVIYDKEDFQDDTEKAEEQEEELVKSIKKLEVN